MPRDAARQFRRPVSQLVGFPARAMPIWPRASSGQCSGLGWPLFCSVVSVGLHSSQAFNLSRSIVFQFFLMPWFSLFIFFPETSCYIHFFSLNVLFTAVDRRRFSQTFINMILQPLPKRLLLSVHKNLSERSITRSAVEIFTVFCIIRHQVPRSVYR